MYGTKFTDRLPLRFINDLDRPHVALARRRCAMKRFIAVSGFNVPNETPTGTLQSAVRNVKRGMLPNV